MAAGGGAAAGVSGAGGGGAGSAGGVSAGGVSDGGASAAAGTGAASTGGASVTSSTGNAGGSTGGAGSGAGTGSVSHHPSKAICSSPDTSSAQPRMCEERIDGQRPPTAGSSRSLAHSGPAGAIGMPRKGRSRAGIGGNFSDRNTGGEVSY
jgi:hypothetical protein